VKKISNAFRHCNVHRYLTIKLTDSTHTKTEQTVSHGSKSGPSN